METNGNGKTLLAVIGSLLVAFVFYLLGLLPQAAEVAGWGAVVGVLINVAKLFTDKIDGWAGKISLVDVRLQRMPPAFPVVGLPAAAVEDPDFALEPRPGGRIYDPAGSFENTLQVLPFGPAIQAVMEPSMRAGARAFIGASGLAPSRA